MENMETEVNPTVEQVENPTTEQEVNSEISQSEQVQNFVFEPNQMFGQAENPQIRQTDTICAPATVRGTSALGIVRMTGTRAIAIINEIFVTKDGLKCVLKGSKPSILRHGFIVDTKDNIIDEVMCVIYYAPNSFSGEDMVEVMHHGSVYIQQQIMLSMINHGVRIANNGEFSQRAFLNGKMDLTQAEAIADLISARTGVAHKLAMQQLRGGYREKITQVREELVKLLSLLELELDFAEENAEFADRNDMKGLMKNTISELETLVKSFAAGDAFKNGIPVAIIGKPNSGKSTLFNTLLNENRAIVSPISGTTRDTIEESIQLEGLEYRFIDTAGIRSAKDEIEREGIERSIKAIEKAAIILYVCDLTQTSSDDAQAELMLLDTQVSLEGKKIIVICNKMDLVRSTKVQQKKWNEMKSIQISAAKHIGIDTLINRIISITDRDDKSNEIMVTNARHYDVMMRTLAAMLVAEESLESGQPTDIIVSDIREAIHYMGEITGEVTTDEVLNNIFSNFCIGK